MEWRTIDSAPLNATEVLVYDPTTRKVVIAWHDVDLNDWSGKPEWLTGSGDDFSTGMYYTPVTPSHWMPLPDPPQVVA